MYIVSSEYTSKAGTAVMNRVDLFTRSLKLGGFADVLEEELF